MIALLHGYLLEGSGSNLWTRAIVSSLCRIGETVHLVCQENHPQLYDFIAEARSYHPDGRVETVMSRAVVTPGRCILHKPVLGRTLPVYVPDRYEEFDRVVPMVDLPEAEIEEYLRRNIAVVRRVVAEHDIHAVHANHAVLMPQVARPVAEEAGIPFAIMPHGSALEYAVKKDDRFRRRAAEAFAAADRIFTIGPEIRARVRDVFGELDLDGRMLDLNLGVDTRLFETVPPEARARSIHRLREVLDGVERGDAGGEEKRPDPGAERALAAIDWGHDPVLLFVGRLIAAKGPQAVVAALPQILRDAPDARLVVVGHGPLRPALEAMVQALAAGDGAALDRLAREPRPGAEHGMPGVRAFLDALGAAGRDRYLEDARARVTTGRVVFTGYLRHRELQHLFPCCDAAVFPSLVREAGPLVFLEALSSGVLPLGTDFGGMAESLKAIAEVVPPDVLDALRLSPDPARLVADIAAGAPIALAAAHAFREDLRALAVRHYDWTSVAERFSRELRALAAA
ncbi:MAG TPA: glycosyltransferase family 4 protein [Longimicrobiales bacterium]|nr:glycosyltransferase family 4 protein [Longimicrobiales bacterium]